MFRRGKPRILATLAAMLGMSVSTIGCQSPSVFGPDLGNASTAAATASPAAGQGGPSSAPADKQGAQGGSSYLPKTIQQSSYQNEVGKDKAPVAGMPNTGTQTAQFDANPGPIPREINKVSMPPYQVAPPDILVIDAARLVPKPPYRVEPLEVLIVQVTGYAAQPTDLWAGSWCRPKARSVSVTAMARCACRV